MAERIVYLAKAKNGGYARSDGTLTLLIEQAEWFNEEKDIANWFSDQPADEYEAVPFVMSRKTIH